MNQAFICDAVRTPFGRFGGALATMRADDLAALPLKALLARNPGLDPSRIDDVIFGCANQAGEDNRNVARMALLLAGLPESVPGSTINRLCGSSLDAIGVAARAIKSGETQLMIAGGVESMSRAPFVMGKAESAFSRSMQMEDTTIGWRFINPQMKALYGVHSMPETAENVADEFAISRADQDAFALRSQLRTAAAQEAGRFADELIAVRCRSAKASRCCLAAMSTRAAPRWRRWLNCAAWCAPTAALPPVTPPGLTTAPARCCWPARRRCRLTIFSRWPGWSAWRRLAWRRGSWALARRRRCARCWRRPA